MSTFEDGLHIEKLNGEINTLTAEIQRLKEELEVFKNLYEQEKKTKKDEQ